MQADAALATSWLSTWSRAPAASCAWTAAQDLGPCPDVLAVTHGQRAGIGGAPQRWGIFACCPVLPDPIDALAKTRGLGRCLVHGRPSLPAPTCARRGGTHGTTAVLVVAGDPWQAQQGSFS